MSTGRIRRSRGVRLWKSSNNGKWPDHPNSSHKNWRSKEGHVNTDSSLAAALAASNLKIPVLHVEAGLRSFYRHQPEEQNRVLTDHLAELFFAPTDTAVAHLHREGIAPERIVRTGVVMADAARILGEQAEARAAELLKE